MLRLVFIVFQPDEHLALLDAVTLLNSYPGDLPDNLRAYLNRMVGHDVSPGGQNHISRTGIGFQKRTLDLNLRDIAENLHTHDPHQNDEEHRRADVNEESPARSRSEEHTSELQS